MKGILIIEKIKMPRNMWSILKGLQMICSPFLSFLNGMDLYSGGPFVDDPFGLMLGAGI